MYADDTVLFTHGKDPEQVATKLTLTMQKVTKWLNNSCLTLNTEKTITMFFRNKYKQSAIPNINVDGKKLTKMLMSLYTWE